MSLPYSKHLSALQIRGVLKAGDIIVPGSAKTVRFSDTHVLGEIDRMLDYMSAHDLNGFKFLTSLFGFAPRPVIWGLLALSERAAAMPVFLSTPFRLINMGVKGVIFTMYYSDLTPGGHVRKELGWQTKSGDQTLYPTGSDAASVFARAQLASQLIRKTTVKERLQMVLNLRHIIMRDQNTIMDQIQSETGKCRSDALMSEIFPVLEYLDFLEKYAVKSLADRKAHTPIVMMGKTSHVFFEPLGVTLCISPWNYPFYQAIVPATLSFICGNAVVYKPSELTPLKGLVERLLSEAAIPTDWIQVVYGDGAVGKELIEQKPQKIFFIGSAQTGSKIMEQASRHLIPVELELGGKDPMIVFEDANLDRAAAGAAWGAFTNTGQSCTSVERVYVQESVFSAFRDRVVKEALRIKVAVDTDGDADMGHMTSEAQVKIIAAHIEDALSKGARLLTGQSWNRKSKIVPPLVLENVTHEMMICREESFGPVLPLLTFRNEEHAVALANDSDYGLSASVWTADKKRAVRVARSIVTGNVSINNIMLTEGNHALPFGGVKKSGFGRFKGEFGFYSFTNIKSIIIDSNSSKIEANWYPLTAEKFQLFTKMMNAAFSKGLFAFLKFAVYGMKLEGYAKSAWKKGRR